MMSNGTSGDANIWDFVEPDRYPAGYFEKSNLIGSQIAEKVPDYDSGIGLAKYPCLAAGYEEIPAQVNKPTDEELEAARQVVTESDYENLVADEVDYVVCTPASSSCSTNFRIRSFARCRRCESEIGFVGGLPGEFFAETGLWLKANAGSSHYFTIGLANGNVGYVPSAGEIARGGYETWRCRISCLETAAK